MEKGWHCWAGFTLTGRDGTYCGRVGCAIPCSSQEDGWAKALTWLRKHPAMRNHLVHTFEIDVRYF